jgi:hypothetical protein
VIFTRHCVLPFAGSGRLKAPQGPQAGRRKAFAGVINYSLNTTALLFFDLNVFFEADNAVSTLTGH